MLRAKKSVVAAGVIAVFAVGVALAIDKRPDSPGPGSSSKELVAAARRAYELKIQHHLVEPDRVHLEEVYLWSKRWMTAEWDLSLRAGAGARGVKTHVERMIDLENRVAQANQVGTASSADLAAATYYRTEAELMLARTGE